MVREHEHRDQKFLGSYQLFGPAPALRAALEGARQLSEMKNAQVSFRMPSAIMRERPGNRLRTGHAEIVQVVGLCGVREIEIDHAPGKIGAFSHRSVAAIALC